MNIPKKLTRGELSIEHNSLVEAKMNLLNAHGIFSAHDNAYLQLPLDKQAEYLAIQQHLELIQSEMIRGFYPDCNRKTS